MSQPYPNKLVLFIVLYLEKQSLNKPFRSMMETIRWRCNIWVQPIELPTISPKPNTALQLWQLLKDYFSFGNKLSMCCHH